MTLVLQSDAPALTRRRFGQWGLAAAATGVAGCGGGGGGSDGGGAEPPVQAGLYMVAGALGGSGFAVRQGAMERLPVGVTGLAFNRQGDFQFVGWYKDDFRLGRKPRTGAASFLPLASSWVGGQVFDALDRYLVTQEMPGSRQLQVAYLQADGARVALAGGASSTVLRDGRGSAAAIQQFSSPLLAADGRVYFIDLAPDTSKPMLRALSTEGDVTTVLEVPNGTVLLESPSGGVRRFSSALYPAVLTEWADLVSDGTTFAWRPLANQWPFDRATPLVKVPGTAEVYWAVANNGNNALAQIDLAGRWLGVGWNLPGPLAAAAVDRSVAGGSALYVACSGASDAGGEDGVEILLCWLDMPSPVISRWLGLSARRGTVDGSPEQARFSFLHRTDALADGAGGLLIQQYQDWFRPSTVRTVNVAGQVGTWPLASGGSLLALAYGHVVSFDAASNSLVRAIRDGQSGWKTWVTSDVFAPAGIGSWGVEALRTDPTGLLWFAKRYRPLPYIGFPPGVGTSLVGTVDETGNVRVVAGDPQAQYTPLTYPPLAQRPWYFDIADMAFEGGAAPVSWLLCNRIVLDDAGEFVRFHSELVRIDSAGRQAFALPATATPSSPVAALLSEPYTHLCVLAGRPGEVFISSTCGIHRWTQAKGLELLAGETGATPSGVLLGPLPAGLNVVKFLAPGPDRRSLYAGSENSVLKLVLPD